MRATRLFIAILGLVVVTAVGVSWWTHHQILAFAVPRELERIGSNARQLAARLDAHARSAALDTLALARSPDVIEVVGGGGAGERARLAAAFEAQLSEKPWILQLRLIAADSGMELVRVDRSAPGRQIRIVPDGELQDKSSRSYVDAGRALAKGEVHVSEVDLNREHGRIERPLQAVVRSVAPVYAESAAEAPSALVVLNLDMTGAFQSLSSSLYHESRVYIVDSRGDYLLHPSDPALEFASQTGAGGAWQRDFADFVRADTGGARTEIAHGPAAGATARRLGIAFQPTSLEPGVSVIETAPYEEISGSAETAMQAAVLAGGITLLGALIPAALLSALLIRPLKKMASAVHGLREPEWRVSGMPRKGEFAIVADACDRLAEQIRTRTSELGTEIEERRRVERELRDQVERERTHLAVIESCEDAVVTGTLDGRITAWNAGAERLYGFSAREAIGQPIDILVPPEKAEEVEGVRRRVKAGERIRSFESVRLDKWGRRLDVSLSVSPLLSSDGEIIGIAKMAHDISDRKEAEERFRLVVEACPSGLCVVGEDGKLELVNQALEDLFGYAREELIGRSVDVLVPQRTRGAHADLRSGFMRAPESRPMGAGRDLFAVRKDGVEIAVEIGLSPLVVGGRRTVLASVIDVTERRRQQAQLASYASRLKRSNAELEKFAYVVSHDIKAPLRGIASVAQWIADDFGPVVDDDARENLGLMLERTGRLSKLIEGILEYSRAGRAGVAPERVDSSALVDDVIASIDPPPGTSVRRKGEFPIVMFNEIKLQQVFQNLIDNAVTHMQRSSGEVVVSCRDVGGMYEFRVADDGVGIPERHFERIFELFQTLRPKDETGSAGAGLAIAKRIVEINGGTIRVESTEGVGTTFTFTVPKRPDLAGVAESLEQSHAG